MADVLDGLASLVDKSLVRAVDGQDDRWAMLETIREFALEELEQSGEAEEVRRSVTNKVTVPCGRSTHVSRPLQAITPAPGGF